MLHIVPILASLLQTVQGLQKLSILFTLGTSQPRRELDPDIIFEWRV